MMSGVQSRGLIVNEYLTDTERARPCGLDGRRAALALGQRRIRGMKEESGSADVGTSFEKASRRGAVAKYGTQGRRARYFTAQPVRRDVRKHVMPGIRGAAPVTIKRRPSGTATPLSETVTRCMRVRACLRPTTRRNRRGSGMSADGHERAHGARPAPLVLEAGGPIDPGRTMSSRKPGNAFPRPWQSQKSGADQPIQTSMQRTLGTILRERRRESDTTPADAQFTARGRRLRTAHHVGTQVYVERLSLKRI